MKILNLSLDKNAVDKNSAVAKRLVSYGNLVEKYTVVVLANSDGTVDLAEKVKVISVKSGNKVLSLWRLKRKITKILKMENYDVLTVQDTYYLGKLAVNLAKKFKIGLEVQVHGFEKLSGLRKVLTVQVLRQADVVRVVSSRMKKFVMSEFGVAESAIIAVPVFTRGCNGVKTKKQSCGKFIFLTVGRLTPVKNIELQLKVLKEIVKQRKNVELWIVGEGPDNQELRAKSQNLGISNYVKFFGWQANLEKFYLQADVFLLTSNSEGWGMAVVEAASFSLPIIMTDVGLAGEVIIDGQSGMVIPVNDADALRVSMITLLGDLALRDKYGSGARAAYEQLPNFEQTLALYKKSWEKTLKKR